MFSLPDCMTSSLYERQLPLCVLLWLSRFGGVLDNDAHICVKVKKYACNFQWKGTLLSVSSRMCYIHWNDHKTMTMTMTTSLKAIVYDLLLTPLFWSLFLTLTQRKPLNPGKYTNKIQRDPGCQVLRVSVESCTQVLVISQHRSHLLNILQNRALSVCW